MLVFIFSVLCIFLALLLLYKKGTKNHGFFVKMGLKNPKPLPFLGNSGFIFQGKYAFHERSLMLHNLYPEEKVIGNFEFTTPSFHIRDVRLLKQLVVKDFSNFQDHRDFVRTDEDNCFNKILVALKGKEWRDMRSTLSPLFTGRKMKIMFGLMEKCCENLIEYLHLEEKENNITKAEHVYEAKNLFSKFSTNVIASCAFGLEIDCLKLKNEKNEFLQIGEDLKQFQTFKGLMKMSLIVLAPKLAKLLDIKLIDDKTMRFFNEVIIDTMNVRKENNIYRPDMIQLLLDVREGRITKATDKNEQDENDVIQGDIKRSWTNNEIIAQCMVFFLAGYDTTSTAMEFLMYELALNLDIQEKLYKEVQETFEKLNGKSVDYDTLQTMKYMAMVVNETLRKWPPGILSDRICLKDYDYECPEENLKFTIEKGNVIVIPIYPYHMDEKNFPNPTKFDPERFSEENRSKNNMEAYIPFGIGPRHCIGIRFALMEIKLLLYYFILNFKVVLPKGTDTSKLEFKKSTFAIVPEKNIELCLESRKKYF